MSSEVLGDPSFDGIADVCRWFDEPWEQSTNYKWYAFILPERMLMSVFLVFFLQSCCLCMFLPSAQGTVARGLSAQTG